ncbi:hypothetical protein [Stutzerimonas nosocomialis]|uniref:hypothetical protein n=1 Tax=Stutzerimonas nosocomialis TaxID=1056496 RepID=UPI001108F26C|nr:hypothetical protein [Stutzerimonas nosocomialis]
MALGMLQRIILKKFIKNFIKAVPFNLREREPLAFSATLLVEAMVSHFTQHVHGDYEKYYEVKESIKFETIVLFSALTGESVDSIKGMTDSVMNVVFTELAGDQFSSEFYSETVALPHYSNVFITKERLTALYELYKIKKSKAATDVT